MYYVWLLRYLAQLVKQEMHLEAKYDPNVDTWKAHKHMYSHIHTANSGRSEKQLGTYLCIYLIICVFTWLFVYLLDYLCIYLIIVSKNYTVKTSSEYQICVWKRHVIVLHSTSMTVTQ